MGTISGSGAGKVPVDSNLQDLFKNILKQTGPARKLEFSQLTEALQTGGVGARIPIIQRAVEAAMGAGSQAAAQGRETTARAGIAGSAFDVAQQLGGQRDTSAAIAGIGPAIASQMIGQGPQMIASATGQGLQAEQQFTQQQQFNAGQIKAFYEDLKSSLSDWASKGGGSSSPGPTPTTQVNYASSGYGNPATFNPSGAQFQE